MIHFGSVCSGIEAAIRVGYDRVCDACAQALRAAGVAAVAVEGA